ncbi:MAG: hypothetical protein ACTSPA_02975 [Promethearchaeota archaeon]
MTTKPNQSHIKNYFDFSNPNWKKRHYSFIIFEIFNLAIIIAFLILCSLTNIWKITSVSAFIGIFIITIILFINKKAWYRYLSYIFVIFGMVFAIYIPYLMDIPPESNNFERFITVLLIIGAIVDFIFLLNYVSIEYSQRRAKTGNLKEYGIFIGIKRNM